MGMTYFRIIATAIIAGCLLCGCHPGSQDYYGRIKVGMTKDEVLQAAGMKVYETIERHGDKHYRIVPSATNAEIPADDIPSNAFWRKSGYDYPVDPIPAKAIVFDDGLHFVYVYLDESDKVVATYTGGS